MPFSHLYAAGLSTTAHFDLSFDDDFATNLGCGFCGGFSSGYYLSTNNWDAMTAK
jgi:hypothetical protein